TVLLSVWHGQRAKTERPLTGDTVVANHESPPSKIETPPTGKATPPVAKTEGPPSGTETPTAKVETPQPTTETAPITVTTPPAKAAKVETAKAETPSSKAAPPAAGDHTEIDSTPPGAVLFIDGEEKGTTPAQLELASGDHKLVVAAEGYKLR